jgi:ABC-2 type transport system permease protein
MISGPLLRRLWRAHRGRLTVVAVSVLVWAFLMPVVYATFGRQMEAMLSSGMIPDAFLNLMGSDPFSLDGSVALGAIHPIAIALQVVYPVGLGAAAIAGERQRGTLEVLLSRPVSRRSLYLTLLLALVVASAVTTVAFIAGTYAGSLAYDVAAGLDPGEMALLGLNTLLLLAALASVSLAASASFDRVTPAIGIALAVTMIGYVLEILGSLWPDARWLQAYSPFHYLQPLEILDGKGVAGDLAVLAAVTAVATVYGLWRFPRRDLAAPT